MSNPITVSVDVSVESGITVDILSPAVAGIPVGGSTGQVLAKASAADLDTQWITPASGGGAIYAEQATAANRPQYNTDSGKEFLLFDGSNDNMTVSGLDFSGTSEITVVLGLRKLTNHTGIVIEHGPVFDTTNGTFAFYSSGNGYQFAARGTSIVRANDTTSAVAPVTHVASGTAKIDGASSVVLYRLNKSLIVSSTGLLGTGNFVSNTFNIGRRNSTSIPWNGRIYGLIVRGALTSGTDLTDAEDWMNTLTGAY